MRSVVIFAAFAAALSLSACKEEKVACTQEVAQERATELMARMQEVATTNPEKMLAVAQKAQALQADLGNAANDPAKVCEAVDELAKLME